MINTDTHSITKLAVCLVLDCSPSMDTTFWVGNQQIIKPPDSLSIESLNEGIKHLLTALKEDEVTKPAIDVAIITFSGEVKTVLDFQTVAEVDIPLLETDKESGGTSIGSAVALALDQIETKIKEYQEMGLKHHCPWLILVTDGHPTDYSHLEVAKLVENQVLAQNLIVFSIGMGTDIDMEVLTRISPKSSPLRLEEIDFFHVEYLASLVESRLESKAEISLAREGINAWTEYLRRTPTLMSTKIKVAGEAVIGKVHEKKQLPKQDQVFIFRSKKQKRVIIALADGAGSCSHSQLGAEIVTSQVGKIIFGKGDQDVVDLNKLDEGEAKDDNFERFFNDRVLACTHLHQRLLFHLTEKANSLGIAVKELASTLLFVVLKETKGSFQYLAGHIGDGVIIQFKDNQAQVFSPPEQGEFSNTTFFVTSKEALTHFRLYRGVLNPNEGFMLFSDGVADTLYHKQTKTAAPACANMFEWLDQYRQNQVKKAIRDNLEKVFREESPVGDDCSLAMLKVMK
jgi:uncharacterized protein YegL/serine/threonine protein phosphatase PrpC